MRPGLRPKATNPFRWRCKSRGRGTLLSAPKGATTLRPSRARAAPTRVFIYGFQTPGPEKYILKPEYLSEPCVHLYGPERVVTVAQRSRIGPPRTDQNVTSRNLPLKHIQNVKAALAIFTYHHPEPGKVSTTEPPGDPKTN